ncbi:MAG: Asp-tRNA(Asn)/Glu-tRNA(Gln) amidotransferase subunit GatA [Ginsengibacter sp.]
MFDYTNIEDYHHQLFSGEYTCLQAVVHYIQQIRDAKNLNAFVHVYEVECLTRAEELDRKRKGGAPIGKLHGVVIAIKDVICYKDHPVTAASAILEGFHSLYNSTAVQKLLDEEAIIIGSTNCDEFAMGSTNENSSYGVVLNAVDNTRVPGGSSGGSAVAVQARLCMISLGSDTGGSVRQPADFCGIVGFKPSYGSISRHGLIAYASSFDQIGIFANNIQDVAATFAVISGQDEYDSTVRRQTPQQMNIKDVVTKKYRIAYFSNAIDHASLDPEIKEATTQLISELKEEGHYVKGIEFDLLDYIVPVYYVLTTAEASSNLSRYDGVRFGKREVTEQDLTKFYTATRSKGFGKEVKRRLLLGTFVLSAGYHDAYFTKAQQVRTLICQKTENIFKDFDAILIPTVPVKAFKLGDLENDPITGYLADIYTVYANLAGIPGISVPLFKHRDGLPFGVQIMSNKYNELTLLELANELLITYRQPHFNV